MHANVNRLDAAIEMFRQRSPNVVALLGNSLGNLEYELRLLKSVRNALSDGDLLLLEVRLNSDDSPCLGSGHSPENPADTGRPSA